MRGLGHSSFRSDVLEEVGAHTGELRGESGQEGWVRVRWRGTGRASCLPVWCDSQEAREVNTAQGGEQWGAGAGLRA